MRVYTIVATYIDDLHANPVLGIGSTFAKAVEVVNVRLNRRGTWNDLRLPDGDASVIRSTPQGNIRFNMEYNEVQ